MIQCNEGGLLACLGYPTAYEDAPHRAVRAALRLLEDLTAGGHGALLGHSQLVMNPWVAVHTGTAIAQCDNEAVSLVGEARSVAARLTDGAERGAVVCTEATHRLILGQFDCESLGHRTIKGVSHPLEIFAVRGTRVSRSPVDIAAPRGLTPLTGRSHELLLLQERWDQARQGMGQVVLITGEAGLGKSRLVYEIKRHIVEGDTDADDAAIVEWRCSPHFENTGLHPAIDFYERLLNFSADDTPAERHQRLLSHLEEYGLARPELVPLFASLLSVPHTETFPALGLSPVRAREETLRAIGEWLHAYASRRPILLVVEDLQWADASTLEFLGEFVGEGLHDCMLSLFTFRSEFRPPWPAGDHQTTLALTRLTRRQVEEMIRDVVADQTVAAALTTRLHDRTGGVPLFVEEFAKVLQPAVAGDSAGATARAVLALGEIPATLQDLLMARLDRIDGDRAVVQLAATLGREFRYEMIAAVAAMDDVTLQEELQKLVQAEILYQKGRPPGAHYTFKHALLENAAYNSMLKPKRREFHQRIAETLVTRFQTAETHPELVALHFTEAGLTRKGADYWLSAGVKARQRSAEHEAINHLTKGLSLLDGLEASPDRDQQILHYLGALAPAYIAIRGYAAPEVGPILSRARALCEQLGEPVQLFAIMLGTWEWRLVRGDIRLAEQLASEGMALAEWMNDPGVFMEALFMPGVTLFCRGEFARSRAHHEQALAAYDDRERTREWSVHTGHNAGVTHRCYLAQILWYLGYPDQAIKMDDETRALAATIAHPFSLAHAVDHTALLYLHLGRGTDALVAAEEEIRIATDQGFPLWHSLGLLHKGGALTLQGKAEEGLSLLLKGFADFRATGSGLRVPYYHGLFCEAYLQLGRFPEARAAVDEGLRIAEQNDDRFQEAELHRLKGELMLCGSRDEVAAEACFQSALGVARYQQSKSWELRATVSLAKLWIGQGRESDAGHALSTVYSSFTEGWTTPDLLEARALLDRLGH